MEATSNGIGGKRDKSLKVQDTRLSLRVVLKGGFEWMDDSSSCQRSSVPDWLKNHLELPYSELNVSLRLVSIVSR